MDKTSGLRICNCPSYDATIKTSPPRIQHSQLVANFRTGTTSRITAPAVGILICEGQTIVRYGRGKLSMRRNITGIAREKPTLRRNKALGLAFVT